MIEESYVSFETARMLKEAGFDVPCNSQYMHNGFRWDAGSSTKVNFNEYETVFSCPTLALAARWLREVHGIHISSNIFMDSAKDADGKIVDEWTFWSYDLFDNSGRMIEVGDDRYDSYEEALEAGLQEAIKLIKK